MNKSCLVFLSLMTTVGAVCAVEIPKELHGKWSSASCPESSQAKKKTGVWSGIVISKSKIEWDSQFCGIKKVAGLNGKYTLGMHCTPKGDEDFDMTYIYEISDEKLKESALGEKWSNSYKKCS